MFNIGDLVCLKSGGPVMTVESVAPSRGSYGSDYYWCCWFDSSPRIAWPSYSTPMLQTTAPPTYGRFHRKKFSQNVLYLTIKEQE
jgi:uncharacterized protein YodC (DUF2158 family)